MNRERYRLQSVVLLILVCVAQWLLVSQSKAQDPFADPTAIAPLASQPIQPVAATQPTKRWLMLCCGLPGDDEHREKLTSACQKIIAAAKPVLGVEPENLRLLAGDEQMQTALADNAKGIGICTKQSIIDTIGQLGKEVAPTDSCWVILLGHANLYGNHSNYNILDADINQVDFAAAAKSITCREQVFWITMPVSGFWIKPLARHSRVVISATEADFEITATEMPYALADLLAAESDPPLGDTDQDGVTSLLDLYLAINLQIHGLFKSLERLQTAHAQLEDNGDGRGSEVQTAYLPIDPEEQSEEEEEEEEADVKPVLPVPKPIVNSSLDGFRSRQIRLIAPK